MPHHVRQVNFVIEQVSATLEQKSGGTLAEVVKAMQEMWRLQGVKKRRCSRFEKKSMRCWRLAKQEGFLHFLRMSRQPQ